ncbi:hypothetical protein B0A52_09841 [Exophiala mesophila]|uniref:N-acetyltransferase domain-containing protein n=1 Tax=Exophiala mesophila TaxID=212818 RepID=A0A438MQP6_EXOME|nr:hypothetical protein B0A52_09841 [Exophiala mesophila]
MAQNPDSISQSDRPARGSSPAKDLETTTDQLSEGDFVPITHKDIEMQDHDTDESTSASQHLDLQRFGNNLQDIDDANAVEDDSEDDDHDPVANHPLLNMLSGRLGARRRGSSHKWDHLHPENQALSVSNVDQCTELEEQAFPPEERASREKFQYRLTRCPELTLGLFTQPTKAEAEANSIVAERSLIAHVISTRTPSPCVTEASMEVPADWKSRRSSLPSKEDDDHEPLGHQDQGGTICIHSVAVSPKHQKIGLGTVLMKSYIARIKDSKSAQRLALLAHDHLVPFYQSFGFENMGPSSVTSHGGHWNNMILEFNYDDDE